MKHPCRIAEDDIRRWVDNRSFDRGRGYFRADHIFTPHQQGDRLKARCHGSLPQPYHVEVTLSEGGIASASCSCPVGAGGHCKHVAALLLTWLHAPERFSEVEELEANLQGRSKEELITIITRMLAHSPDLESLLELPVVHAQANQPIDPDVIRKQVNAAFSALFDGGSFYEMEQHLQMLISIGDDYAQAEAWQNAATVYGTLAERALVHYEWYYDEEGELTYIVEQCVEGLEKCLAAEDTPRRREGILRALFDIHLGEAAHSGMEMVSVDTRAVILEQATAEERKKVTRWVRSALTEGDSSADDHYRQVLGSLLINLEMDQLSDEEFLRICRETGQRHSLLDRLLALGRVEEATSVAQEMDDYALLHMAHVFEAHDYGDVVEQLVRERISHHRTPRLIGWLVGLARKKGDLKGALQLEEELFWGYPSMRKYRELEELARRAGRWKRLRAATLGRLAEEGQFGLLTDIYLEEGEVDRAIETLKKVPSWRGSQAVRVAEAAEEKQPREAIDIYVKQAEGLIAIRGRDRYAEAAGYLTRVRDIYRRLGEERVWQSYIAGVREENRRLRALRDELNKAGL